MPSSLQHSRSDRSLRSSGTHTATVYSARTIWLLATGIALAAGLPDIGENYVQEARPKRDAVAGGTWHLIGGLQRNKVRAALATFARIHTVDSVPLAKSLGAAAEGRRYPVLIQVNVGGEDTKRGASVRAAGQVDVLVMSRRDFRSVVAQFPLLEEHFGKLLRERHPQMLEGRELMDCVDGAPTQMINAGPKSADDAMA